MFAQPINDKFSNKPEVVLTLLYWCDNNCHYFYYYMNRYALVCNKTSYVQLAEIQGKSKVEMRLKTGHDLSMQCSAHEQYR